MTGKPRTKPPLTHVRICFCFFFFLAGGIEDSHVLNWRLVLKSEIALNVCTTALQDTQENQDYANWNGAPPLPREPGKGEDL